MRRSYHIIITILATMLLGCRSTTTSVSPKAITSEDDLDRLIAGLSHPETRMWAFSQLLAFALPDGYDIRTGDRETDRLHDKAFEAVRTCPERDTVVGNLIHRLQNPDTRMEAISDLIRFAGTTFLYNRGGSGVYGGSRDREFDTLRGKAADALNGYVGIETISRALDSPERHVQFWGVWRFGSAELSEEKQKPWLPLLPKLEKLAVAADAGIRDVANQRLDDFPQAREFLAKRVELETSPDILMRLMRSTQEEAEFNQRFVARLYSLLNHPDENVRRDALSFIGFNSFRAPMWRFTYDKMIFDRVIELTQSRSAEERSAAAHALTEIRLLDLEDSRRAFLRMATDSSGDVRSRVASGLKEQFDRADVKPVIVALLQDKVPVVRYMTILTVGPEQHVKELEQLTQCDDRQVAEWATGKLKQISENKSKP
jgi:HEAT repeat protein